MTKPIPVKLKNGEDASYVKDKDGRHIIFKEVMVMNKLMLYLLIILFLLIFVSQMYIGFMITEYINTSNEQILQYLEVIYAGKIDNTTIATT